jgi:hypothetical protein
VDNPARLSRQTPAQLYCTLVGGLLIITGIVGFFYSSGFDTGASGVAGDTDEVFGVFAVNGWDNVVCIAWGLLALALANSAARSFALGFGLYAVVIAIWGFVDGDDVTLGFMAANGADNVLDLVLGLTGLAAGAASPAPAKTPRSKRQRPPRERKPPEKKPATT